MYRIIIYRIDNAMVKLQVIGRRLTDTWQQRKRRGGWLRARTW